jgi:hypothetical protein
VRRGEQEDEAGRRRLARSRRRGTSPAPAATRCPAGTEGGCAAAQRGA